MEFLDKIDPAWYGILIFISAFVENIFPPYPGDIVIVFGGFAAVQGKISAGAVISLALGGSLSGAILMYFAGGNFLRFLYRRSEGHSHHFFHFFSHENLKKAETWFRRYGAVTVLFSRFVAGVRFFAPILAGLARMRFSLFLSVFLAGTLIWNGILVVFGFLLGKHWEKIVVFLKVYNYIVVSTLLVVGIFLVLIIRRRRKLRGKSSEN